VSGGAGLVFKGSGFYITDYKRKNGEAPSESKPASDKPAPATPPSGDTSKKSE